MDELPEEIKRLIITYLDDEDIIELSQVSQEWLIRCWDTVLSRRVQQLEAEIKVLAEKASKL